MTPLRFTSIIRNHPLARECDIVETLHMRLTLLQMTFGKHIERKHVCFFAGEVSSHNISRQVIACVKTFIIICIRFANNAILTFYRFWMKYNGFYIISKKMLALEEHIKLQMNYLTCQLWQWSTLRSTSNPPCQKLRFLVPSF